MTEMCKWGCLWRDPVWSESWAKPSFLEWRFNTSSVNFIKCLCWYLPWHLRDLSLFLLHSTEARKVWCLIFHWNYWNREILTEMTKLFKCIILSSNLRLCKSNPLKDLDPNNLLKITLKLCIMWNNVCEAWLPCTWTPFSRWRQKCSAQQVGWEGGWSQPAPASFLLFFLVTALPAVPTKCLWVSHARLKQQGYFKRCK